MDRGPDPFAILAGAKAPVGLDREGRVRMLADFAAAVLAGREPDRAAMMFVAGGIHAWLQSGGSLTRDFWRTAGPQGCTVTESLLARRIAEGSSRRAQAGADGGTVSASTNPKEPA